MRVPLTFGLAAALLIGLVASAAVAPEPAGAEPPEGTRVTRTTTVTIDFRQSESQQDRVEAALDACQDRGVECEYSEGRPFNVYEQGILVGTYTPTIVRITYWEDVEPPAEAEPEPWTRENSGCSANVLDANAGKEIRCGSDITVPPQRAQTGSVSRPRAVSETYTQDVDHDEDPDTPDITQRTPSPHRPTVTGTFDRKACASTTKPGEVPASYQHSDDCQVIYRYSTAGFDAAQQYGTLRSITTPARFDYAEYNDDDVWSEQEEERAARALAIHHAQWDAYEQAVDDAYERGQPFWTCYHISQFEDAVGSIDRFVQCRLVEP